MNQTPNNRFAKLFALAKELGMTKELLSAGAAQWTGQASLRSLNGRQLAEYEKGMEMRKRQNYLRRRAAIAKSFQENEFVVAEQRRYLIDLISSVFQDIEVFREWFDRCFAHANERFLSSIEATRVIKALNDMRKRGFKTWQGN